MKLNNNMLNTISIREYGVADQLLNIYNPTVDISGSTITGITAMTYIAEGYLQFLAHSTLSDLQSTTEGLSTALNYLNNKVDSVRKTVSFWDAYQIYGVLEQENTMAAQLTQLPNNSSVVNNMASPFNWIDSHNEEHTLYRGDILFKDYLGEVHLIPSTNKGVYKPIAITQNEPNTNNFTITYSYSNDVTSEDYELTVPVAPITDAFGYSNYGTLQPGASTTVTGIPFNSHIVMPIIKLYHNNEEVYVDNAVSVTANNFTITNSTAMILQYEVK